MNLNNLKKGLISWKGLLIALDNLDEVISLIRAAKTPDEAREGLMTKFGLTEIQARAILDMRLQRLTGLERDKIKQEYKELMELIDYLRKVLDSEEMRMQIIKDELADIKERYGDERRTEIVPDAGEFNPEDFYADEEVVITISHLGYIKRTALTDYRTQRRGGVGARGSSTGKKISWSIFSLPQCTIPCCSSPKRANATGLKSTKYPRVQKHPRDGLSRIL
jgi:DNA gyrase subunit A